MSTKKFIRKKEDFICKSCGYHVTGTGYTNHCPECLWSRHVDINPGDRANTCKALMEPIGIITKGSKTSIVHKCTKCGVVKKNIIQHNDSNKIILKMSEFPVTTPNNNM